MTAEAALAALIERAWDSLRGTQCVGACAGEGCPHKDMRRLLEELGPRFRNPESARRTSSFATSPEALFS